MKADPGGQSLFCKTSNALVKRFLSPAVFNRLCRLKTDTGFTLARAIRSGQKNADSRIGIYAGDAQCYTLFKEILEPVITAYHQITAPACHTRNLAFLNLFDLDPGREFILSARVRVARNLDAMAFTPHITRQDRQTVENRVLAALHNLPGHLKGCYHPMENMDIVQIRDQAHTGKAFIPGDRFQEAAGINRDFPLSRGVYTSEDKTFMVWINEEDHLRIICLEKTGDLGRVFNKLVQALDCLDKFLVFASDPCLGYLNACPTNIGTAMRAGVHIRLPRLEKHPGELEKTARAHGLQIRGTFGEKTRVTGSVFDISNRRRLNVCETRIIQDLYTGIAALMEKEKKL